MKRFSLSILLSLFAVCGHAQTVPDEAAQLAGILVENNWNTLEQSFPTMAAGLEDKLRNSGVSANTAHIFSTEIRNAITHETLTQAISLSLADQFSIDELHEILGFMQSKTGKKFQTAVGHPDFTKPYFMPIVKQACDATIRQVEGLDRFVVSAGCAQIQLSGNAPRYASRGM